jgi:hypothetical protein
VKYDAVRDAFVSHGVKYVDMPRGERAGHARFETAEAAAATAAAAADGGVAVGGKPLVGLRVLEAEELEAYWAKTNADVKAARARKDQHGGGRSFGSPGGGRSFGGRGGRGGGGRSFSGGGRGARGGRAGGDGRGKRPREEADAPAAPPKEAKTTGDAAAAS